MTMNSQTLTVEVKSRFVLRILEQLASLNLIELVGGPSEAQVMQLSDVEPHIDDAKVAGLLTEVYKLLAVKTLSKEAFIARILESNAQIDRGDHFTLEELERESSKWD